MKKVAPDRESHTRAKPALGNFVAPEIGYQAEVSYVPAGPPANIGPADWGSLFFTIKPPQECYNFGYLDTNLDASLADEAGWNTMVVEARDQEAKVYLNGHLTACSKNVLPITGRIGFQLHNAFEADLREMKYLIRRIEFQNLD